MDRTLAQSMGVLMVIAPLLIWTANAMGFDVIIPESHFPTLIWAGVSLILGYNAKSVLEDSVAKLSEDKKKND